MFHLHRQKLYYEGVLTVFLTSSFPKSHSNSWTFSMVNWTGMNGMAQYDWIGTSWCQLVGGIWCMYVCIDDGIFRETH